MIYGTGGIGKTSLAALAPDPVFLDIDHGANKIRDAGGNNVRGVSGVETFEDLRAVLHDTSLWGDAKTVVVDSGTAAQKLAEDYTLRTVKHEKNHFVTSIEAYGFGKGYQHVLETYRLLLGDLDVHRQAGRHVVLVCHSLTATVPNPEGDDFLQYQPDLYEPPKTGRIRGAVKNWCEHLVYIGYDVVVKDGVGVGCGSRTIQPQEMPHYWAKSRSLDVPIPYVKGDDTFWKELLKGKGNG